MTAAPSPSQREHERMAAHNEAVIQRQLTALDHDDFYAPWTAAVAFYKAVHLAEVLFLADPGPQQVDNVVIRPTDNHADRRLLLRSVKRWGDLYDFYKALDLAGHRARYTHGCPEMFMKGVKQGYIRDVLVGYYLREFERRVLVQLKHDPDLIKRIY